MIDTQEKLEEIVKSTLKEANEKTKEFPLYENVDLSGLPYSKCYLNFKTKELHDDFISRFCDGNNLIGEALFDYIIHLYSSKNKVKSIDYLNKKDLKEIQDLNPKYCLGKFVKEDFYGRIPEIVKDIKEIYNPDALEENENYVVLIKDENSAKICLEFSNEFNVSFCPLAYTKDDLKAYPHIIDDAHLESSQNDDELYKVINTYMCNLSFGYRYSSYVDENNVIVYKINRTTRSKVLSAKLVK